MVIFWLILAISPALGDVSLSFSHLEETLKIETSVVNILDESIKGKNVGKDATNIRRYIGNFRELANNLTHDFEDPLHAYLVVKHLTDDFENLKNSITDQQLMGVLKKVNKLRHSGNYPTSKDLDGSAQSLIRLQQIYDLKINEVSKNKKLSNALGMFDYFRLAGQSLLTMDVSLAIDWFEKALKIVNQDAQLIPQQTLDAVKQQFETVKGTIGSNFESLRQQIRAVPDFMIDALALQFPGVPVAMIKKFKSTIENVGEQKIDKNYKKLCRGTVMTTDILEEDKICVLLSRTFYQKLSPYKVEILSTEPAVFLIHGFVRNLKAKYLKDLASTQFEDNDEASSSHIKGALSSVVKELSDDYIASVSYEINKISGLKIKQKPHHYVQFINYGIGGYDDYATLKQVKSKKVPKLTVDISLNDLSESERTVFPGLRFGVTQQKGSALFAYHVQRNKKVNYDSFYASCPIRAGSKWVLRKEIF